MFGLCSDQPAPNDVMVSGIGMVTPLGLTREASWAQLISGETAACRLSESALPGADQLRQTMKMSVFGAPLNHELIRSHAIESVRKTLNDRAQDFEQHFAHDCLNNMLALSLLEACADANLLPADVSGHSDDRSVGCVVGTSKSSLRAMEAEVASLISGKLPKTNATDLWLNALMPDAPLRTIRWLTQSRGPSDCPVAACATGLISVIQAARMIQAGDCDICIAGSADAALRPSVLAGFHRLGVLSKSDDARTACKPFDGRRDGFVIGEGAAVVILESRQHAEAREATCYGRLAAGGWLSDPTGMTQIDTSGHVVSRLVRGLVEESVRPDHIQLHATATETNDLAEGNGLHRAFGANIPICSAAKGATGHLLGASGSVEFAFAALSLRDGMVPPSVNHEQPDPACCVRLFNERQQPERLDSVLKLSLGFGGHIAGCVIRR